jgi:putative dimethyl sulfoxide reductase chaperone
MTALPDDAVDEALARAVVYRTLSLAFQPPNPARPGRITDDRSSTAIVAVAVDRLAGADAGDPLTIAAAHLASIPAPRGADAETTYWRLFGHTARGPVCACETEYGAGNAFQQPQQLADISGYYLAFGLRPGTPSEVRVDHIACECEFADFLGRKEAVLASSGAPDPGAEEALDVTREAYRTFLRDHLGRFGCAFGARLAAEDEGGYYGALGNLLLAFLRAECARVGVQNGPVDLAVRAPDADDTPVACGSSGDLIQIQRRP